MTDLKQLAVFIDGCAARYKSKSPFHHLSDMKTCVQIHCAYSGSRHGKGPCDVRGGVIEKMVEHDILSCQAHITNARTMFDHCAKIHSIPFHEQLAETCCHTRRVILLLEEGDIDRSCKSSELISSWDPKNKNAKPEKS